jgi:hypothetical protein
MTETPAFTDVLCCYFKQRAIEVIQHDDVSARCNSFIRSSFGLYFNLYFDGKSADGARSFDGIRY